MRKSEDWSLVTYHTVIANCFETLESELEGSFIGLVVVRWGSAVLD
jgi:hypothetical protein